MSRQIVIILQSLNTKFKYKQYIVFKIKKNELKEKCFVNYLKNYILRKISFGKYNDNMYGYIIDYIAENMFS